MLYNVVCELAAPRADAEELADRVLEALADHHAALIASPRGRVAVVVTVDEPSVRHAFNVATALVQTEIPDRPIVSSEVMSTSDYDAMHGAFDLPEVVNIPGAADILGVTRTRVRHLVDEGKLPHRLAGHTVVIPRAAVEERAAARAEQTA